MNWIYLAIAGLFEIAWAVGLKYTEGWTRLVPSLATAALMIASFYFLSIAVRTLPIGTAYAVWTGIGAAGTAIYGMIFLGDVVSTLKIISITLVIVGVIGLQLSGSAQ